MLIRKGIWLWRLASTVEFLFHPRLEFCWTESIVSAFNFHPSLDLAFVDESIDILGRVAEKYCCLFYSPGACFMFKLLIRIHFCPFLYPVVHISLRAQKPPYNCGV